MNAPSVKPELPQRAPIERGQESIRQLAIAGATGSGMARHDAERMAFLVRRWRGQ